MSYEEDIKKDVEQNKKLPGKLNISVIKYFWQINPLTGSREGSIPRFLRTIEVFKNFSDNELRILAKFLHIRSFGHKEIIFNQGELGIGFYIIYSGLVEVLIDDQAEGGQHQREPFIILPLEKGDYFGELALLQEKSARNATVRSRENCELLGIFKPDVEELIQYHPIVAAKLLQSISVIVANRLFSITREVKDLKFRLAQLGSVSDDRN